MRTRRVIATASLQAVRNRIGRAATTTAAALLVWGLFAGLGAGAARAQSTNLVVDVDGNITLTCLDTLSFTATSEVLAQIFTGTSNPEVVRTTPAATVTVGAAPGRISAKLGGLDTSLDTAPDNISGTATACRVDASPSFRDYGVAVARTGNTVLDGPGNSRVRVTSVAGRINNQGSYQTDFTIPGFQFFFDPAVLLQFRIGFDLSGASRTGLHSSNVPGTFTVTVTRP